MPIQNQVHHRQAAHRSTDSIPSSRRVFNLKPLISFHSRQGRIERPGVLIRTSLPWFRSWNASTTAETHSKTELLSLLTVQ